MNFYTRLTESGNTRSEQLLVVPITYRVANQPSLAVMRTLEWSRTSKARLVFRYEISDLFITRHTPISIVTNHWEITTSHWGITTSLHSNV